MESENAVAADKTDENNTDGKKKHDRERKKGEKKLEQFMKSIANFNPEEKVEVLSKKYHDNNDEIRNLKACVQMLQRKITVAEREKEQLQNEQSKCVLARSRLEALCRELQRQNKSVKEESLQKIREEEEKRKEISNRFQAALNEVTQMMQQNKDKNLKLRDDNLEVSSRFQKLCEQFKEREEQVVQLTKQMDLEKQLAEATVRRAECQLLAERELWEKEKEQLLKTLGACKEEKSKLEVTLKCMEEHLSVYSSKYEEFESTIAKSNQVFDSYKSEMSRMSKQVNKLEKDCNLWKERWIQTQKQLNRIMDQKIVLENDIKDRDRKLECLSSVCRTLQKERGTYLKQLKDADIEPQPVDQSPPATLKNIKNLKSKKEKELAKAKKSVRFLEAKLNELEKNKKRMSDTNTTSSNADAESANSCEPEFENEIVDIAVSSSQDKLDLDNVCAIIEDFFELDTIVFNNPHSPDEEKQLVGSNNETAEADRDVRISETSPETIPDEASNIETDTATSVAENTTDSGNGFNCAAEVTQVSVVADDSEQRAAATACDVQVEEPSDEAVANVAVPDDSSDEKAERNCTDCNTVPLCAFNTDDTDPVQNSEMQQLDINSLTKPDSDDSKNLSVKNDNSKKSKTKRNNRSKKGKK